MVQDVQEIAGKKRINESYSSPRLVKVAGQNMVCLRLLLHFGTGQRVYPLEVQTHATAILTPEDNNNTNNNNLS